LNRFGFFMLAALCCAGTVGAATLFDPAKGGKITGGAAHWLTGDLKATVVPVTLEEKKFTKIAYSGKTGIGIVKAELAPVQPAYPGGKIAGLRLEIGYGGEEPQEIEYFISFKDKKELRGFFRFAPGVRFYDTRRNSSWKDGVAADWNDVSSITFFLREGHFAKTGKTPVWQLGRISALEDVVTTPLTAAQMLPMNYEVDLSKGGTAILPRDPAFRAAAEAAAAKLEAAWGVTFNRVSATDFPVNPPAGNFLLFGDSQTGPLLERMLANGIAAPLDRGYEIRSLANLFTKNAQVLYVGAATPADFTAAAELLSKAPGRFRNYLAATAPRPADPAKRAAAIVAEMKQVYAADSRVADRNTRALFLFGELAGLYQQSHDPALIPCFREALDLFVREYPGECVRNKGEIPSFHFYKMITVAEIFDAAPELTPEDRLKIAEQLRFTLQQLMEFWEMRPVIAGYQEGKVEFYENHELFACRSVVLCCEYLNKRCDLPALDYFRKVAMHGFKGGDLLKIGPEDSGGYQFICRMHWIEICQRLGLDYDTANLRYYIEFTISQVNHLGHSPSYGDEDGFDGFYGWNFLLASFKLRDDKLAAHLLAKQAANAPFLRPRVRGMGLDKAIQYTPRQLGATVFPLLPDLQKYYGVAGLNRKTPLNKAVFRNGFEEDSSYFSLGGMNSPDPHSHRDANGVLQYSRGRHYWLIDRGYVEKMPYFHNVLQVARDRNVPDLRSKTRPTRASFAEIDGGFNAPEGQGALLTTTLYGYAGIDWARHIFWTPEDGFWVIDGALATVDGDYVLRRFWRVLGEVSRTDGVLDFSQKSSTVPTDPTRFTLSRGDDAPTLIENAHDPMRNSYPATREYPYARNQPVRAVRENFAGPLKRGEERVFADFFSHPAPGTPAPRVRQLAPKAWLSDGGKPQLALLGAFASDRIRAEAAQLLITTDRIVGRGVKLLEIDGKPEKPDANGNLFVRGDLAAAALAALAGSGAPVELKPTPALPVPDLTAKAVELSARITALAASGDRWAAGCEDGTLALIGQDGGKVWSGGPLGNPVSAILPFERDGKRFLAVGTRSHAPDKKAGELALFDEAGKMLWSRPIEPQDEAPGSVMSLGLLARGNDAEPVLVCAQFNGQVSGWSLAGDKLWRTDIYHGACPIIATADFDGDGRDEALISERWRTEHLINADGKIINSVIRTIGFNRAAFAADVDGDGKPDAITGNDDGYLRIFGAQPKYQFKKEINAGGRPLGIAKMPDGGFAVGVDNNAVNFFSAAGERLPRSIAYPTELLAMTADGDRILTVDATGTVYLGTPSGVTGKFAMPGFEWHSLYPPLPVFAGGVPAAASGKNLWILTP
jgi:hypothetical protein